MTASKVVALSTQYFRKVPVLVITQGKEKDELKAVYRTAWEIPQRQLIDMAADRGAFIDQSQSLNLFMETPTIGKLSSMYLHAWKQGLKTTYYLRSRPATKINKATTAGGSSAPTGPGGPGGGAPSTSIPSPLFRSRARPRAAPSAAR